MLMTFYDDRLKAKLVAVAADIAVFRGWSEKTLEETAAKVGVPYGQAKSLFPRGGIDLARFYHQLKDQDFLNKFRKVEITNLSHFEKVEVAIKMRFQVIADDKEVFKSSMSLFAMPMYQLEAINLVWSTCDLIWCEIKDISIGFDWYTKRATLVSVYLSTLLFFLGDESADHRETEYFIVRRLQEVRKLGQLKVSFIEFIKKLMAATR